MKKHLVLVGGGHAHMTVMLKLADYVQKGHKITLISPSPYHYYSGMGPGMLGGVYRPQDIRFNVRKMVEDRGASFLEDKVIQIDALDRSLKLASGESVTYDIASFNTGSSVPLEKVSAEGDHIIPAKPIINLLKGREQIIAEAAQKPLKILTLGGGPAGVEIAGNVWRALDQAKNKAEITMIAGSRLLKEHPPKVRDLAVRSLENRGIRVLQGLHAGRINAGKAELSDGSTLDYDFTFASVGVSPSQIFRDSGLSVGKDGGLLVNAQLQAVDYPEIFGGGDCISFQEGSLAKVGVYAVRENPILYHNLMNSLEDTPLIRFEPQKEFLLILNMGNDTGIFRRDKLIFGGKIAFVIKNWIDQRFMKEFQVSGERLEPENLI